MRLDKQAGAAALILITILLFGTSVGLFYLNRSLIAEQHRSANQARSTSAQEVAEAGIEWATGMINSAYGIKADCTADTTTSVSFRKKYVTTNYATSTDVAPATTVYPGCTINGTSLSCGCPASGTANPSNTNAYPSFTVSFAKVTLPDGSYDTESVAVTSLGCTGQTAICSSATTGTADAYKQVSVILKLRPMLRAAPAAALTCGTTCTIGGSFDITNTDAGTNGIVINSGNASTPPSGQITSLPGQPSDNAVVGNDSSLKTLAGSDANCSNSAVFKAYFGSTLAQYKSAPSTDTISCGSPTDCGSQTVTAYNQGWRSFYYPNGVEFNNASFQQLGTATDPVTLVSDSSIKFNGNIDIYGLVFSNNSDAGYTGTGSSDIHGAFVTCGAFNSNGNGSIEYDPTTMKNVRRNSGLMVRVPGSWKDF